MIRKKKYDILEYQDLKEGMILELRTIEELHEMEKLSLIDHRWCSSMDEFAKKRSSIVIDRDILGAIGKSDSQRVFPLGTITRRWRFTLSMFKIQEREDRVDFKIIEKNTTEERGNDMRLEHIFIPNEKENLEAVIAGITPAGCLTKLSYYLSSGISSKGDLERKYYLTLISKLADFLVELHINSLKSSAQVSLAEILKKGTTGFENKSKEDLIRTLDLYNSIDSFDLVKSFMATTLEEVVQLTERTAKENKLIALKEKEAKAKDELEKASQTIDEIQEQIKELEV